MAVTAGIAKSGPTASILSFTPCGIFLMGNVAVLPSSWEEGLGVEEINSYTYSESGIKQ
jgi:hypothetical protein